MSETTSSNNMIDSLLGRDVQTDHGGLSLGDIIVLILDAVLLIYTGWRSYDFLTTSVPEGYELLALVGLWGLDIGAIAWSLVWIFGSSSKYQDWVAMFFFVFDLSGVILTSLADSLMHGQADGPLTEMIGNIAVLVVPLIVVANAVAGFIYHMTSPQTKHRRAARRSANEFQEKMSEIDKLERDLAYAEAYVLARQEMLDKTIVLAEIKKTQDRVERDARMALRDQTGIHGLSAPAHNNGAAMDKLTQLRKSVDDMKSSLAPETLAPVALSAPSPNGHKPDSPDFQ